MSQKRSRTWILASLGLIVVALVIGVAASSGSGSSESETHVDFALPDFNGETVRLSGFRGKGLVLNYWASWCFPCLAELPGFEQVYQRHRDEVGFLGVNLADDPSSAAGVIAETGITYPLAIDADGSTYLAFGASAMPTTMFISPDGEVLELFSGDLTAGQLEEKVVSYFGEGN